MYISGRFKRLLKMAQKDGHKNLWVTIGSYYDTTYISIYGIDYLLSLPVGETLRNRHWGRWAGTPNKRHVNRKTSIKYSDLYRVYGPQDREKHAH